jgi:hypothetical protein
VAAAPAGDRPPDSGLEQALAELRRTLEGLGGSGFELAFYGGTFTLLPGSWAERFLEAAVPFLARGTLSGVRCSTRPDAVTPNDLRRLAGLGLSTVELGVQSFDREALAASGRGYGTEAALAGCAVVREAGLDLVVQLLPGLPGDRPGLFGEDLRQALAQGPRAVRLYPCLVIEGAPLAALWRRGRYAPWPLARAVEELARAWLSCGAAGVPVIRAGVAPQAGLAEQVLAGPLHPALGQMARSLALWLHLSRGLAQGAPGARLSGLAAPRRVQGEFWGHGRELAPRYAALGLTPAGVRFEERGDFRLTLAGPRASSGTGPGPGS